MTNVELKLEYADHKLEVTEETAEWLMNFVSAESYHEFDTDHYKIIIIKKSTKSLS